MNKSANSDSALSLEDQYWLLCQCSSEASRQKLLARLQDQDKQLAAELRRMLRLSDQLGDFMRLPDAEDAEGAEVEAEALTAPSMSGDQHRPQTKHVTPRQIGPYRLLEPIGEGGMGVVYLAQQTDPVRRRVAIKIIKPGMDSRQVIARFEAERQALAMMNHTNIAKVLDAGTSEDGLPYFVMELVRGIPITEYCERRRMSTRDRIRLAASACGALQHAHNKGVIHRDIKPSNVLVTEHDGTPVVKVIDFGVAKALTDNLTDKTLYTGVFQMVGTPLYMSPEQASLSNVDVDTRSDVYSLGVLLYELISGTPPIDHERAKAMSFDELRQHICHTEPPSPSERLSSRGGGRSVVADSRPNAARALSRFVVGELDWIVMRAIEKDRRRRYQSPRELANDLQRFLDGEAVEACPPSWQYRLRKTLWKYRVPVSVAMLVMMSLTVGLLLAFTQARRAEIAERAAVGSQRIAERNADQLQRLLYGADMLAAGEHYRLGNYDEFDRLLKRYDAQDPGRPVLRGFEWYFLRGLAKPETETIYQCEDAVRSISLSQSERWLVVADSEGRGAILDGESWTEHARLSTKHGQIFSTVFLTETQFVTCGEDGSVSLWNIDPSHHTVTCEVKVEVCDDALSAVCHHPDWSQSVLVGSDDGRLYLVDLASRSAKQMIEPTGREVRGLAAISPTRIVASFSSFGLKLFELPTDHSQLTAVEWPFAYSSQFDGFRDLGLSDDRQVMIGAQLGGLVTVFDLFDKPVARFSHLFPSNLMSIAVSPDGQVAVVGDTLGNLNRLSLTRKSPQGYLDTYGARARRIRSWRAHEGKCDALVIARGKRQQGMPFVLSAGRDGRVIRSFLTMQATAVTHELARTTDVAFVDNQRLLIAGSVLGTLRCQPLVVWQKHRDDGTIWRGVQIASDGRVFSARNEEELVSWNDIQKVAVPDGESWILKVRQGESFVRWCVSPDGEQVAVNVRDDESRKHRLEMWSTRARQPSFTLPSALVNHLAFTPDSTKLAYVHNNDVVIIEALTGTEIGRLSGHTDAIRHLAYSPDGHLLASVSNDRTLKVWDAVRLALKWSEVAHEHRATAVTFHPHLPTIVTVGDDSILRFWRVGDIDPAETSRLVGEYALDAEQPVKLQFSPNGKQLTILDRRPMVSILSSNYEGP
jgi:serine/threonine protein kinase/WD40 repeat protein